MPGSFCLERGRKQERRILTISPSVYNLCFATFTPLGVIYFNGLFAIISGRQLPIQSCDYEQRG